MSWPLLIGGGVFAVVALVWAIVRIFYLHRLLLMRIEWHMSLGRHDRALPLIHRNLEILRRKKGETHIETAVAKFSLGHIEYLHGRKENGRRLVDEATAFFRSYDGPQDDEFGVHLLNLGVAQRGIDSKEEALLTFRQAVEFRRRLFGDNNHRVAEALNNVGVVLEEMGQPAEALRTYEEAMRIRCALHGERSTQVATVRLNIAEAQAGLALWAAAEQNIRLAIEVLSKTPSHALGQAYDTYARVLEGQENWQAADQMRTNSLTALQRELGENNVEVAKQMEKYARLLDRLNRRTERDFFEKKAAAIRGALA